MAAAAAAPAASSASVSGKENKAAAESHHIIPSGRQLPRSPAPSSNAATVKAVGAKPASSPNSSPSTFKKPAPQPEVVEILDDEDDDVNIVKTTATAKAIPKRDAPTVALHSSLVRSGTHNRSLWRCQPQSTPWRFGGPVRPLRRDHLRHGLSDSHHPTGHGRYFILAKSRRSQTALDKKISDEKANRRRLVLDEEAQEVDAGDEDESVVKASNSASGGKQPPPKKAKTQLAVESGIEESGIEGVGWSRTLHASHVKRKLARVKHIFAPPPLHRKRSPPAPAQDLP